MKKFLILFCAVLITLALCSCTAKENKNPDTSDNTGVSVVTDKDGNPLEGGEVVAVQDDDFTANPDGNSNTDTTNSSNGNGSDGSQSNSETTENAQEQTTGETTERPSYETPIIPID